MTAAAPQLKAVDAHAFPRADKEWYVEPEDCAWALAQVEKLVGKTRDPSCGGGNVVRGLSAAGIYGYGTDLVDRRAGGALPMRRAGGALPMWRFMGTSDFLQDEQVEEDNFVFNPPYGSKGALAELFVRRAMQLARNKVCAFLPLDCLASSSRWAGLFADHPFSRVWVLTPRPSCPPGDVLLAGGKAEGGRQNYCWFVWDKADANPQGIIGQASRLRK